MEDIGIADPFDLAVILSDCGFTESDLHTLISLVGEKDAGPVLHWFGDNLLLEKMVQVRVQF
jgi:hypothetical protein